MKTIASYVHWGMPGRFPLSAMSAACLMAFSQLVAAQVTAVANEIKATDPDTSINMVEISSQSTRSSVSLRGKELQSQLPGMNPLKGLETLPGVSFSTADPWGNNEQNLTLFVHGFNGQQLGYTMDGVPLGDQQYGNYNGLSPQRAVISENVRNVVLSSGAGDLATPSTSNLGGTIEVFSSDPLATKTTSLQQTLGSHNASRTFVRFDTGNFGNGNSLSISGLHQEAKAWDFDGKQSGNQMNAKFVHLTDAGKLTLFLNYSDKTEPNEDATVHVAGESSAPYTRPFLYPNFGAALAYLSTTGNTPAADGSNYHNYYSDAQRTDYLTYAKYDWNVSQTTSWTNQVYFHHDDGVGVVAGPIGAAGLPALFNVYFPGQNLKQIFGNSGYATRATQYVINRPGIISTVHMDLGEHQLEFGGWWEHNNSSTYRRWFALDVNNPSTPYQRPTNPLITQYGSDITNNVVQLHLQDEWRVKPNVAIQAGFKSSLQFADGEFPVQPLPGAISGGSLALPVGKIDTKKWFLPELGILWDINPRDQFFANIQKNMRQFVTYGAGGASPWSLASQSAFDLFKNTAQPESSVTYEMGIRGKRDVQLGALDKIDGQVNLYHVDFSNRLLQISPTSVISAIVGGNPVLANVGSVTTDGIDIAGTLHFSKNFSLYNAFSYNRSVYGDNYLNGSTVVPTSGKQVPGAPQWMDKVVATATFGDIETQLSGDYVGRRYATYTNDLHVGGYFMLNLGVTAKLPSLNTGFMKNAKLRLNVTNLNQITGAAAVVVGAASGTYNTYPIAPRQVFATFGAEF